MTALPVSAPEDRFRRILAIFESPAQARAMLESLAELAHRLKAALHGIYVEDTNLVRLTEQTETSVYRFVSYGRQSGEHGLLAHAVRSQAVQSRRIVEEVTRHRQVPGSFQVRQGKVATEIISAAQERDLVVIPKPASKDPFDAGVGALLSSLTADDARKRVESILLFNPHANFFGAVSVVYDGSPGADLALDVACDMAALGSGEIEVVMLSQRLNAVESWQSELYNRVVMRGLDVSFLHLTEARVDQLCARSRRPQAGLMVLGLEQPLLQDIAVETLFRRIDCSVMLVR